ncbi:hypothetical protein CCHR01_03561 [Colletotrichum chrysophilum]|uniref:Uncharacterized protein n=1 Tax=Colletotrichum chrysophilum TaxID=1836956 RepID=A0AAD9ATK9_9PEZI|nr:hypothetical protein CCHR01_03561 [Colletotrichum chrysophilum]
MGLGFQFTAFWEATRAIAMYLIILISTQSYIPAELPGTAGHSQHGVLAHWVGTEDRGQGTARPPPSNRNARERRRAEKTARLRQPTANQQPEETRGRLEGGVAAQERRRACANPIHLSVLVRRGGSLFFSSKILARFSHLTSLSLGSPARILTPKKDQVTRIACGLGRVDKQSNDKGSINHN